MKKISTLEKKLNASAFAFVVAMAATSYSHAHTAHHGHGAYVGLDAVYNWIGFKKDYGQNIFKKQAPGVNVFAGYMFHENFGAELGFEWDKKVKKDVTIPVGDTVAGTTIPTVALGGGNQAYKTYVKQSHPYLGLLAKTDILAEKNFLSLTLGLSLSNIKAQINNYSSNGVSVSVIRNFSKTKLIPFVKVAFEHKFTQQWGAKLFAGWRNTSAFKLDAKETANTYQKIKFKDTFNVGFGVAYYI